MNKFEQAVSLNEVADYLAGNGTYFFRDHEIAENHSPAASWGQMLNYATSKGDDAFNQVFWSGMEDLLRNEDVVLGLWYFTLHLENYISYADSRRIVNKMPNNLIEQYLNRLADNKYNLNSDTRSMLYYLYSTEKGIWEVIFKILKRLNLGFENRWV